jgi:glycosyltransferase involved in cell wall biosynthesis
MTTAFRKKLERPLNIVVAADNIPHVGVGLGYFLESAIQSLACVRPSWTFTIVACSSFPELSAKTLPNVRVAYWDDSNLQRLARSILKRLIPAIGIPHAIFAISKLTPSHFLRSRMGNLQSYYHGLGKADVVWVPFSGWGDDSMSLHRNLSVNKPRILLTIHDIHPVFFPEDWSREPTARFWNDCTSLAHRATGIITHTEFQKEAIAVNLGISREKIAVTPIPPSLAFADNQADAIDFAAISTLADMGIAKTFALYPGSSGHTHKNHIRLILAWAALQDRLGEGCPQLVCTAKGHLWAAFNALISALSLQKKVIFLDTVSTPTLKMLFAECAFVIVPTLYEGGGSGPVADGILAGKPVVCSDIPVIREQLEAYGVPDNSQVFFDPESIVGISMAAEVASQRCLQLEEAARINKAMLRDRLAALWRQWAEFYCVALERVSET